MSVIIKPIVTEKMTQNSEKFNRFGFQVRPEANKLEIKAAVEALYNVTVVDVNTSNVNGKAKSRYTKSGVISGEFGRSKRGRCRGRAANERGFGRRCF